MQEAFTLSEIFIGIDNVFEKKLIENSSKYIIIRQFNEVLSLTFRNMHNECTIRQIKIKIDIE